MCRLSWPVPIRVCVKLRFHQRLQVPLDYRLGHPIRYGRDPQTPLASVLLRYSYRSHRRRKIRPRRHPIPDLVQIVLQILLEFLDRFRIDPRPSLVRFHPLIRFPYLPLGNVKRLRLFRPFLPFTRLSSSPRWMTRPLRSAEFPRPLRYYGSLRPCASLRYSHPGRAAPWISPLPSRRQVPTFRTRAWSRVTPPLCRVPPTQATGFSWTPPGLTTLPGSDTFPTLSTRFRWFIRFVSSGPHLMRSMPHLLRDAHHPGS